MFLLGSSRCGCSRSLSLLLVRMLVVLSFASTFVSSQESSGEDCDNLSIGSFYFININAWSSTTATTTATTTGGRHGEVAIMGFQDIPGNLDLYLTDRAWNNAGTGAGTGTGAGASGFVSNTLRQEGITKITTPPEGFPAGVPFGMGDDASVYAHGDEWIDIDVNGTNTNETYFNETYYFDLGLDGDQVFLYCVGGDGKDRPIAAISYNGPFRNHETNKAYGTNKSSAPDYFLQNENNTNNDATVLGMPTTTSGGGGGGEELSPSNQKVFLKWQYIGPMTNLDFYELQDAIRDTQLNWLGSNPDGTTSSSATTATSIPTVVGTMLAASAIAAAAAAIAAM